MSKTNLEWPLIAGILLVTALLVFYAEKLNKESFNKVVSIIYGVKPEIGNLRLGPSTEYEIIKQMKEGDIFTIIKEDGNWFFGKHVFKEGWVHRSILSKYLYLSYYDDHVVGKSLLEIQMFY
jgi:uncharacterized protein YgiM (DUF1202 family)